MHKWVLLSLTGFGFNVSAAVYAISTENFNQVFQPDSTKDNISGVVITTSNVTPLSVQLAAW